MRARIGCFPWVWFSVWVEKPIDPRKSSTTIGERYFFYFSFSTLFYFSSSSLMFRLLLLEQDLKAAALPLLKRFGSVLLPLVVSTYNEPKACIKLLLSLAFCHIFMHGLVHLVYIYILKNHTFLPVNVSQPLNSDEMLLRLSYIGF